MENMTSRIERLVEDAVNRLAVGWSPDTMCFNVSFTWTPLPEKGLVPAYNIILTGPSPIIGQALTHLHILEDGRPTQKDIDGIIIACLASLNEQKAKVLSLSNGRKTNG